MKPVPVSFTIFQPTALTTLDTIKQADKLGVPDIWVPTAPMSFDPLTLLPTVAGQTTQVRLGMGIVPTYPRHPAVLASQALVMAEVAPERFRLGIGSSHPFIIEGMYGIPFGRPLGHLREYLTVLRSLLWEGHVDFSGTYYRVKGELPPGTQPPRFSIPIAALQKGMFQLAGEIADGAIAAWCPVPYLLETALPAIRRGADKADRPVPPLIANVPVIFHTDFEVVRQAARAALEMYMAVPAYFKMFATAGFRIGEDRVPPDDLIDELFAYGEPEDIANQLRQAHEAGIDEVMVTVHSVSDMAAEEKMALELLGNLNKEK